VCSALFSAACAVAWLSDASPKLLNQAFVKLLAQTVREKGVGLLIEVGPQSMPQDFDSTLLDLLPVQIDRKASGVYAPPAKPFKLELTPDGVLHEAMQLYDEPGRNQAAWAQMLPYQWCVAAIRPSPAATADPAPPDEAPGGEVDYGPRAPRQRRPAA